MQDLRTPTDKLQGAAASLLNGLVVLEAFSVAQRPLLGVTEISELVGLHTSTVSRMLTGSTEAGCVQRDDDTGSQHQVKHSTAIGTRDNEFTRSSVRVFLAELPPAEVDRLLADRTVLQKGYRCLKDPAHEQLSGINRGDGPSGVISPHVSASGRPAQADGYFRGGTLYGLD